MTDQLEHIRDQLSYLHEAISSTRMINDSRSILKLNRDCLLMQSDLEKVRHIANDQEKILTAVWEEEERRIHNQKSLFKSQVNIARAFQSLHKTFPKNLIWA